MLDVGVHCVMCLYLFKISRCWKDKRSHLDQVDFFEESSPKRCSRKFFTHASPTLFNAGTPNAQMSSCFLLKLQEDSIEGVYDTLKKMLGFCEVFLGKLSLPQATSSIANFPFRT